VTSRFAFSYGISLLSPALLASNDLSKSISNALKVKSGKTAVKQRHKSVVWSWYRRAVWTVENLLDDVALVDEVEDVRRMNENAYSTSDDDR